MKILNRCRNLLCPSEHREMIMRRKKIKQRRKTKPMASLACWMTRVNKIKKIYYQISKSSRTTITLIKMSVEQRKAKYSQTYLKSPKLWREIKRIRILSVLWEIRMRSRTRRNHQYYLLSIFLKILLNQKSPHSVQFHINKIQPEEVPNKPLLHQLSIT